MITIRFVYSTGINREIFRNVRLLGSWDINGRYSPDWPAPPIDMPMQYLEDGCPSYVAMVQLDPADFGREFHWGVRMDAPQRPDIWGIPTEVNDRFSDQRHRSFVLIAQVIEQRYYLTHCRRIGAQKRYPVDRTNPAIEFSVWAPNATKVQTVIGKYNYELQERNTGYISDDGDGVDSAFGDHGSFAMQKDEYGIWHTDPADQRLSAFKQWDHKPYMFRVTKDDATVAYRTDLYSRCQIGKGSIDPGGRQYSRSFKELDGTKSCSVIIDPETVTEHFAEPAWPETKFLSTEIFWANEFDPSRPVPHRVEDLIIYELHVGSLGFNDPSRAGDFSDAIKFLDYLIDLGVNAVELLPVLQYEGVDSWGYGTSHPFALEYSVGGRDQLKHLIRECHRRGLAVIMDVVYNHYNVDAERAEWAYDSNTPENNIHYWYEGHPSDYPAYEEAAKSNPQKTPPGQGGYLDNYSTGYDPRLWHDMVRKWFISSAVALAEEFHVDGFRVDLTQALYQFNVRHGDGLPVDAANAFGVKFLREWTRTIKMVKPQCILIAEDHSDQAFVTELTDQGGLGFDATWYSTFYHHLVGDGDYGTAYARLLYVAGFGDDRPLAMDYFAGALSWSGHRKVVYHEDHDDAGNALNTARTMITAVNNAPLIGDSRRYAEARCRCVCGLSLLSAATPMFLMGEEIASPNPMPFQGFRPFRDDFFGARAGTGASMFKFYQDLVRLRRNRSALRSRQINVIYTSNENRLIAFTRTDGVDYFLVAASLNNQDFSSGYWIPTDQLGAVKWHEVFNSDATIYGGRDVGNVGRILSSSPSGINVVIPANGFVVFQRL